jgi:carbamoyl-phosphate synthase small subunit
LPETASVSHLNLNDGDVEGVDAPSLQAFSVQYHPEAGPGPHDARYLFAMFTELMRASG